MVGFVKPEPQKGRMATDDPDPGPGELRWVTLGILGEKRHV